MLFDNLNSFNLLFTTYNTKFFYFDATNSFIYKTFLYLFYYFNNWNILIQYYIINYIIYYMQNFDIGVELSTYTYHSYIYIYITFNNSFVYSLKFLSSILILIFIRAGIPRYRYDFLTKLGWIKFFLYSLFFFVTNYVIFILL